MGFRLRRPEKIVSVLQWQENGKKAATRSYYHRPGYHVINTPTGKIPMWVDNVDFRDFSIETQVHSLMGSYEIKAMTHDITLPMTLQVLDRGVQEIFKPKTWNNFKLKQSDSGKKYAFKLGDLALFSKTLPVFDQAIAPLKALPKAPSAFNAKRVVLPYGNKTSIDAFKQKGLKKINKLFSQPALPCVPVKFSLWHEDFSKASLAKLALQKDDVLVLPLIQSMRLRGMDQSLIEHRLRRCLAHCERVGVMPVFLFQKGIDPLDDFDAKNVLWILSLREDFHIPFVDQRFSDE